MVSVALSRVRRIDYGRLLLAVIETVLFGIGWVPARAAVLMVAGALWARDAMVTGWEEGRKSLGGDG